MFVVYLLQLCGEPKTFNKRKQGCALFSVSVVIYLQIFFLPEKKQENKAGFIVLMV